MPERTKYLIQVAAETAGAVIVAIAIFFAAREVSIPETNPVEGQSLKFGLDFGHFKIESDILYHRKLQIPSEIQTEHRQWQYLLVGRQLEEGLIVQVEPP